VGVAAVRATDRINGMCTKHLMPSASGTQPAGPRAFSLRLTPHGEAVVSQAIGVVAELNEQIPAPIGGPRGVRGRQLIDTLQTLLGASL